MRALSKIEIEETVKTTQGVIGSLNVLLDEFYQRAWVQWSLVTGRPGAARCRDLLHTFPNDNVSVLLQLVDSGMTTMAGAHRTLNLPEFSISDDLGILTTL